MRRLLFVTTVAALVLAACGGSADPGAGGQVSAEAQKYAGLTGDPAKGKTHFETTCSACHGPGGTGVTGLGKALTTSEWTKSQSDADLIFFLTQGRPAGDPLNTTGIDMPLRGGNPALKDQDLADIVAYLRQIHK